MTSLAQEQTGIIAFAPKARLLKLLGAELISDEVVAITELVKNAYDADASFVSIQFVGVTGDAGEILIRDDGHGMDLDTLLTRWMQPAGSAKGRATTRFTKSGRRVLGEKGVGRFAADKLGAILELVSRPKGHAREVAATFQWDEFDADERMLSEIETKWELRQPEWIDSHGTVLRIAGLRSRWNERMFRRLSTRLARLASPFGDRSSFRLTIESDEYPEYSGEVSPGFLDRAPYRVEADFDGAETVTLKVNGQRPVRMQWSAPSGSCGPVKARLFAFDLETEALAKIGPRTEVRPWLREWSGVSVYRDGYRIWPYGEPHDDWLRLDQRRVNNPVVCLSNNQVVGFVEITADGNPELRDQTNREGLIHNDAFIGLQRLVQFSLQALEADRQSTRHPEHAIRDRRLMRTATSAKLTSLPQTLERLAASAPQALASEINKVAKRAGSELAAHEDYRRKMLGGYTDLAIAGHAGGLVARALDAGLAQAKDSLSQARSASSSLQGGAAVSSVLDELEGVLNLLQESLDLLVPAPAAPGKRRRGLDLLAELHRFKDVLTPVLERDDAKLSVSAAKGELFRTEMRPESFAALLNVLLQNSLDWRHKNRRLEMTVKLRNRGDGLEMVFSDNGRGVQENLEATLFEPMVSGKDAGMGMGLTLAKNIVVSHGGSISLASDRRRQGASIRVLLSKKRSRATGIGPSE